MSFEHLRWIVLALAVFGVGMLAYASLATVGEGLTILFRRRQQRRWPWKILAQFQTSNTKRQTSNFGVGGLQLEVGSLLPIALGGLAALLAWDVLISAFFLVLGIGASYVVEARGRLARLRRLTREAEILIVKFRSMFGVENSVFVTLERAAGDLPPGEVRRAAHACLSLTSAGKAAADALAPLAALPSPHLRRLAGVLARAESASQEAFQSVLLDLEADIARQLQIEREAGVELAALKGTARALQGAALLAALWAVVVPAWRAYFLASVQQKMLFIFLASVMAVGSMYLEREMFAIEEGQIE